MPNNRDGIRDFMGVGPEALASAIVIRAVDDYREAYRRLRDPNITDAKREKCQWVIDEVENWIEKGNYSTLTNVPAGFMLKKLRKEREEYDGAGF